jgi:hypothetical protein
MAAAAAAAAESAAEAGTKVISRPAVLDPDDRLARPLKLLVAIALTVLVGGTTHP